MRRISLVSLCAVLPLYGQLSITTASLPDGLLGSTYGTFVDSTGSLKAPNPLPRLQADGGSGGYSFSLAGGALPPGMTLAASGALRGVPTATGNYSPNFRVTDSSGRAASAVLPIVVRPRDSSPDRRGRVNVPYVNYNIPCTPGTGGSVMFSILAGSPPPGIALDPNTGFYSGTPTQEGTYNYIWQCANDVYTVSRRQTFIVEPYLRISLSGTVGQPYERIFDFPNVATPIQWQLRSGSLPPGLALVAPNAPRLTGIPSGAGNYVFVIRWTDAEGHLHEGEYTMTVEPEGTFQLSTGALELRGIQDGAPATRRVSVLANRLGLSYTLAVAAEGGGEWLKVRPSGGPIPESFEITASPLGLAEGIYLGAVKVTVPGASPPERVLTVAYTVGPAAPPRLEAEVKRVSFALHTGSAGASQPLKIFNRGSGSIAFTAFAASPGDRLTVTPAEGVVSPGAPATLHVNVDPSGAAPGTYAGGIAVTAQDQQPLLIPVTVTISAATSRIELSHAGTRFSAAPGTVPAPRKFAILSRGAEPLAWSATARTLSGQPWLRIDPASGISAPDGPGTPVLVGVDTTGLEPGVYYGAVFVESPEADNSPQKKIVVLEVAAPEAPVPTEFNPAGLLFLKSESQTVTLTNNGATAVEYKAAVHFLNGDGWLSISPPEGSIPPGGSAELLVQADPAGLNPGAHKAYLGLHFGGGKPRHLPALLVVPRAGSVAAKSAARSADGCTPAELHPIITSLPDNFDSVAGWPTPIEALVADDCAQLMTTGAVIATFSNGDPPLSLKSQNDGRWTATWNVRQASSEVELTVRAITADRSLEGTAKLSGGVAVRAEIPQVESDGVVSTVDPESRSALAPGAMITIRGAALAEGDAQAESLPLPMKLSEASVLIGGKSAPLRITRTGELEAIVPYGLAPNTPHHLVVQRGSALSLPESVVVAASQPAVFTMDGSGKGQGQIYWTGEDGVTRPANAESPARRGSFLTIYCAGLGAVNPPVEDGAAPPDSPLAVVVSPVTVKVGDVEAPVHTAALAPGYPGVYVAVATLPAQAAAGPAVPLTVTVDGQTSSPVTLAIAE